MIACAVGGILDLIIERVYDDRLEIALKIFSIILRTAIVIGLPIATCCIERHESRQWVEVFTAEKMPLELSLFSPALSGLELLEWVKQAAQSNRALAAKKYSCQQWYGFNLDRRILALEPINVTGEELAEEII